jgi:tetratricopeptide (TPR) repeat protein
LAVAARCHGDSETAKSELAQAIEYLTQMPVEDPVTREAEAFEILATISPGAEWMGSVQILVEWLSRQAAPADRLMKRAVRLQDLAADRPSLIPLVDAFLAKAVERTEPAPEDPVAERARWDLMRAEFAKATGRVERSEAILTAALMSLERDGNTQSGVHRSLKAQIVFREGRDHADTRARMLAEILPVLEEGCALPGWQEWFSADAAAAWSLHGDLQLESGDPGVAIKSYNRAVEYADSPKTLANLLLRSGCAYRYAGDPGGAWDAFSLALPIFEKAGDQPSQAIALYGQAIAAKDLGRAGDAAALAARGASIRQRLGPNWKPPIYWREPLDGVAIAPAAKDTEVEPLDYNPVIESKIAKVRREIDSREKAGAAEQGSAALQELQGLYEELDRLLREKITGAHPSSKQPLEVEVLRRKR